jgi:membrane-associated phospholipid phosphatase
MMSATHAMEQSGPMKLPRYPAVNKFVAARLSPEGELGLYLTIGIVLLLCAAWIFGSIAEDVVEADTIVRIDLAVAQWFHAHARAGVTQAMLAVTHLHGVAGVSALGLMLGLYFYLKKAYYWLLTLAVALPGGMLINVLLKYVFQRARPTFENPLLTLATYSFPSGHTAAAALFYGTLAAYLVCGTRSWRVRAAVMAAATLMVLLVGLSRIYLGVHYLSDVLAALAESCAWLTVCITASSALRRRRAVRTAFSKGA